MNQHVSIGRVSRSPPRQCRLAAHTRSASALTEVDYDFLNGDAVRGARRGEPRLRPLPIPDDLLGIVDLNKPPIVQSLERLTREPVGDRLFIDAILADQPLSPSFYDGWKAQQVVQAALDSNDQGCWVTI